MPAPEKSGYNYLPTLQDGSRWLDTGETGKPIRLEGSTVLDPDYFNKNKATSPVTQQAIGDTAVASEVTGNFIPWSDELTKEHPQVMREDPAFVPYDKIPK